MGRTSSTEINDVAGQASDCRPPRLMSPANNSISNVARFRPARLLVICGVLLAAAGLMAGYLTAKLAVRREMTHAGATAGLVAASLVVQPVLTLPVRIFVAGLAVLAISAGGWVRGHARIDAPDNADSRQAMPGPPHDSRSPEGHGGEERS